MIIVKYRQGFYYRNSRFSKRLSEDKASKRKTKGEQNKFNESFQF